MLQFCRRAGAAVFTANFLYVKGEDSEQTANNFYQRLSAFSAGERVLEKIYGKGFRGQECWVLTDESIEAILTETAGNLLAYNVLYLPEDWLFYVGDGDSFASCLARARGHAEAFRRPVRRVHRTRNPA